MTPLDDLKAVLEPLAKAAETYRKALPDDRQIHSSGLTIGDLRRARTAYETLSVDDGDRVERLRAHIEEQITHVEQRIQDGRQMGASIWRIALEDVVRENRAAISAMPLSSDGGCPPVEREDAVKFLEQAFRNIELPPLSMGDLGDIRVGLQHFIKQRAALSAMPLSSDGGWQPISTAPKDGSWIIGLTKHGVVPLRWGVSWNDQHWANGCVVYAPTHWMPLPSAPIERNDDVG